MVDAPQNITPKTDADKKPEWAVKAEDAGYTPKKTIGEKIFDRIAYIGIGDVLVFIASVGLAYGLKYSSRKIPGMKDTTWAQGWENVGAKITNFFKLDTQINKKTGKQNRVNGNVENALMTTALMMPGNLALAPIRWMERRKTGLVKNYNEKYGAPAKGETPSDTEIGEWNTKSEAMQSWSSLLKGRVVAWLVVFSSLTTLDKLRPKALPNFMNKTGILFEDAAAKLNLADKPKPGVDRGPDATRSKNNKRAYFFGEIASIDFFADIAAIAILYVGSKFFAKRSAENTSPSPKATPSHISDDVQAPAASVEVKTAVKAEANIMPRKPHSDNVQPREASYAEENTKRIVAAEESLTPTQVGG
ncbi:MAG: hypothetical protein P8P30_06910 [Rickettsiales bacterium]|nr:hypothetical protein [Rickettsiales bacterium]